MLTIRIIIATVLRDCIYVYDGGGLILDLGDLSNSELGNFARPFGVDDYHRADELSPKGTARPPVLICDANSIR